MRAVWVRESVSKAVERTRERFACVTESVSRRAIRGDKALSYPGRGGGGGEEPNVSPTVLN